MDFRAAVLPQFFPAHWLRDTPEIVFSDFPSRIRIGYVVREEGAYSYLLEEEFSASGLAIEAVHSCALRNLRKLPSARITFADVAGGAEGFISSEDNLAAARLLLPTVRAEFASHLGNEFLAVLPQRDECFCWSQAQESGRQLRHAAEAVEDYVSDEYNLTPDILLVTSAGFRLFREQDAELVRAAERASRCSS
jgi:uncharacterized protein YtpQ (UPF0354 family)